MRRDKTAGGPGDDVGGEGGGFAKRMECVRLAGAVERSMGEKREQAPALQTLRAWRDDSRSGEFIPQLPLDRRTGANRQDG